MSGIALRWEIMRVGEFSGGANEVKEPA